MNEIEEILTAHGVTPTPVRKLVYKCLKDSHSPLSLTDIESELDTVDKSTISRSLATFKEHGIVRSFTDGSGSMKYETSGREGDDSHGEYHVHFRCEKCGETQCLTQVAVPAVDLPPGYLIHEVNYVITGVCGGCVGKEKIKEKV